MGMSVDLLKHHPTPGDDFMPAGWCGGCEACTADPGEVCVPCSYPDGYPTTPVNWPCDPARALGLDREVEYG